MQHVQWIKNQHKHLKQPQETAYFSKQKMNDALHFHSSLPNYERTPVHQLINLANSIGVKEIYAKDESKRFGLNAFKGLGASYAMAAYFAEKLALDLASTDFPQFMEQVKTLKPATIATVTAGNHGRGVAWAARLFGQQAKVYLPKGSSNSRLQAIQSLGADTSISSLNYDDTVLEVAKWAEENDWVLMQDTAWEGYEKIPLAIMQGYTTIIAEALEQLPLEKVTHVFLQAGVGSFAAAMAAAIGQATAGSPPKIIIVEPNAANCIYQSANDRTGQVQRVYGDLATMMAGLACGEPNPFAWNILKTMSDFVFSCDDSVSAKGMRLYASPLAGDVKVISGESGAVPLGLVYELMTNPALATIKDELELHAASSVFVINTEGDTDPVNYQNIV